MSSALTTLSNDQPENSVEEIVIENEQLDGGFAQSFWVSWNNQSGSTAKAEHIFPIDVFSQTGFAPGGAVGTLGGLFSTMADEDLAIEPAKKFIMQNLLGIFQQTQKRPRHRTMLLGEEWPAATLSGGRRVYVRTDARSVASWTKSFHSHVNTLVEIQHLRTALLGDEWPSNSSRWAKLETEVASWAHLPDDWAEEDGCRPSTTTIDAALSFLARLRSALVRAPTAAFVDADGELGYRWQSQKSLASACFLPDGHIVAYAGRSDGQQLWKLDQRYDADLDLNSLFERMRSLF